LSTIYPALFLEWFANFVIENCEWVAVAQAVGEYYYWCSNLWLCYFSSWRVFICIAKFAMPVYMWLFQSESLAVNHSSSWLDDWLLCLEISLSQNCLIYWSNVFPNVVYENAHFALSLCFLQSRWLGDSFCWRRNLYKWTVVWGPQLFTM